MRRVKFIVNPSSGRQTAEAKIDALSKLLLDDGYTVAKFFTKGKDDAMKETIRTCKEDWDFIIVSGGDGTVNEVARGIMNSERKIPVAILSSGTVNDFANYMNIPTKASEFFNMIKKGKIIDIDLGQVGDNYFVNVAAGGLLTNVGYQVQPEAKARLGRLAYYLEGLREFVTEGIEPIHMKFESEEYTLEDKVLLFLISNSSSIGGFKKLAPAAEVGDGLLDVLIIKDSDIGEIANIFFMILRGDHINHPNVVYFKTNKIKVESDRDVTIDIDGEYGGKLPKTFQVVHKGMKIFVS
ncbi:MAG: diacylglycerol kinase family lipid kinase [Tissierellia bacterium]|nr:diacylglycerol kinase family lipid kinase [Tissierellia bacterium]